MCLRSYVKTCELFIELRIHNKNIFTAFKKCTKGARTVALWGPWRHLIDWNDPESWWSFLFVAPVLEKNLTWFEHFFNTFSSILPTIRIKVVDFSSLYAFLWHINTLLLLLLDDFCVLLLRSVTYVMVLVLFLCSSSSSAASYRKMDDIH